jgi:thiamine biosynthesis protein ThiI
MLGMDLILVRYAELGLKSPAVRRRFERILVDNILSALAGRSMEAIVSAEWGRVFVKTEHIEEGLKTISRVFGVASVSPVISCGSGMEEMKRVVAEFSLPLMKEGTRFAIRARRTGNQGYTSMDVGRELGSAVFLANEHKRVKVDLTDPEVEIYVEVRDRKAYIFSEYVPGPGGLPLGSQGKVLALLEKERDALAAWLIMKRGCRVVGISCPGNPVPDILRYWDPEMRVIRGSDIDAALSETKAAAVVYGYTLAEFKKIKAVDIPVPAFFPLVGMEPEELERRLKEIEG